MTADPTAADAINAALAQNWKEAIRLGTLLVKQDKENVEALNRLGYASLRLGEFAAAKRWFGKVTQLDPYNPIALKNLKKLGSLKQKSFMKAGSAVPASSISPLMFLEEPGKTKVAPCVNAAPEKVLTSLTAGQEVFLKERKHCIEIRDSRDTYIAALPDDLSHKLIRYMSAGNTYQAVIKSVGKNTVSVLIRELTRGKKFRNQPSFTSATNFISFGRTDTAGLEGPDVTPTGEDKEETDEDSDTEDT